MAARIQRRRIKGWRSPEGAVYVGRGSRWGNPFTITRLAGHHIVTNPNGGVILARNTPASAYKAAADWYHAWLIGPSQEDLHTAVRQELAGRDLMCWCPAELACHADVLLTIANPTTETRNA